LSETNDIDEALLRAWLLHQPIDERMAATLEERVLDDDAFGTRLEAIETDLIDDHARGLLDEADRRAVDRWLLATPADRARLRTAVALASSIRSTPAASRNAPHGRLRPPRRALLAFASAAILVLAVIVFRHYGEPATPSAELPTITLLASRQRGAQAGPDATLSVGRGKSATRLQVEVIEGDAYARYTVSVADATRTMFEARNLEAKTLGPYRFVEAVLTPDTLHAGEFSVRVSTANPARTLQEWTVLARSE
jgi:hypothetical protein